MTKKTEKFDLYEIINNQIIEHLEKGVIPWRKTWEVLSTFPKNLQTEKEYNGINVMLLALAMDNKGYKSPYWLTFNQAKALKGSVKKGEKSTMIVYWNFVKKEEKDIKTGEIYEVSIPFLKYYNVFNSEQCVLPENLTEKINKEISNFTKENFKNKKIDFCEKLILNYKIEIRNNISKAFYAPFEDYISLPKIEQFSSSEEYYATLYHEIIHSTGHIKRLARPGIVDFNMFGSHEYSKEELIAEVGSSYLCAISGITDKVIENQSAYIQSWMKKLKENKKWLISAFTNAQKAVEFIKSSKIKVTKKVA